MVRMKSLAQVPTRLEEKQIGANYLGIQQFGMSNRRWEELRSIEPLRETNQVVLVRMENGRKLVVKAGRDGAIAEALAAEFGGIARLGINTVKTVPVAVATSEVKDHLFPALRRCAAGGIVEVLEQENVLLIMPFLHGNNLGDAGDEYDQASPQQRNALYQAMGRLWAFDVMIENSDRFIKGINTANMLVSDGCTLYGIDQKLGLGATDRAGWGRQRAERLLKELVEPNTRKKLCADVYTRLNRDLRRFQLEDEVAFSKNFEEGLLRTVLMIRSVRIDEIKSRIDRLPGFARVEVEKMGLSGLEAILAEFTKVIPVIQSTER